METRKPKQDTQLTAAMRSAYKKMSLEWQTAKEIGVREASLHALVTRQLAESVIGGESIFRFRIARGKDEPEPPSDWKPDYGACPRWIVCAAMRQNGRIITGARHFDKVMRQQMRATEGLKWWRSCEQGFIDQFGDFLTREEAWQIASKNGQIRREDPTPSRLFSETLY